MQLVFTQDIHRDDGAVKFVAGEVRDFPKDTWKNIERNVGLPLNDFTTKPTEALAKAFSGNGSASSAAKSRKSRRGNGLAKRLAKGRRMKLKRD